MIDDKQFLEVIDKTPLISIDLILENSQGDILLGRRVNRPAQDYWFVPGGRIKKNERIADAIKRVSSIELGRSISIYDAKLFGAYDHIYNDNYFDKEGINTHYVVLAYKIKIQNDLEILPDSQHSEIKWWPKDSLLNDLNVHQNTKMYFTNE